MIRIFTAFLLSIFFACVAQAAETYPHYNLTVSFDIKQNLIKGVAKITLPEKKETEVHTGDLKILSVKVNGQPFEQAVENGKFKINAEGTIEIEYEGTFKAGNEKENPENIGVVSGNMISEEGIYLTGGWYPSLEGLEVYSLKAFVPEGFIAISEADEIAATNTRQGKEYSFKFPHPVNNINFVAGKYREKRETFHGVNIYAYFFPEDISLAKTYIEYTKKYIGMYNKLLIPYPFKRFSVVENLLPTGYSMPTFTLLGQEVVRLPFIVKTSLGHEILHQWFGNSVYVDYSKGNWSEGLTSYLSDYLYEEQEGRGWEYRKKILTDYESYVRPDNEFPLKDFAGRIDFASKAIGYGKGAMLFHMLRNITGDDIFYDALRGFLKEKQFREASWEDIQANFEKAYGKDLGWFFKQWLSRQGVISIYVRDPRSIVVKGTPTVSFEIVQNGDPYSFNLPLRIKTNKGEINQTLNIDKEKETFDIPVKGSPLEIVFDGDYSLMRELSEEEYPPVISRFLGDEKRLIVIPEKNKEKYMDLINVFKNKNTEVKDEKEIKDEDISSSSLLVSGSDSPILKRLFGKIENPGHGFTFMVKKNPLNTSKVIAIADAESKDEIDLAAMKIIHYGKYSYLRFEKGRNIEKKIDETQKGIKFNLYKPVLTVQPRKMANLDEIINNILDKPIIYAGEIHTNYEDHKVQLDVIQALYDKGRKFAIGMEMFQKPFQKAIDDYISGVINEREFLKNTQYFKRWEFDYSLYREIIEFAKAKKIPVIALNIRSEIVDKVSKGGLDSLSDDEKKEIPQDMDMSNEKYEKKLKSIFREHENIGAKDFENFYQSQILWDETMAHSVAEYLKKNPDYQIVVLAGIGHVMYDYGIPDRAYRLDKKEYITLIPNAENIEPDLGSYVVFPESLSPPPSLKLGVILKQTDEGVAIDKIFPGSVAEEAGLKEDDILIFMDDWKIENIDDVKIFLVGQKEGEKVKIKLLRRRFLFGKKEIEVTATF